MKATIMFKNSRVEWVELNERPKFAKSNSNAVYLLRDKKFPEWKFAGILCIDGKGIIYLYEVADMWELKNAMENGSYRTRIRIADLECMDKEFHTKFCRNEYGIEYKVNLY